MWILVNLDDQIRKKIRDSQKTKNFNWAISVEFCGQDCSNQLSKLTSVIQLEISVVLVSICLLKIASMRSLFFEKLNAILSLRTSLQCQQCPRRPLPPRRSTERTLLRRLTQIGSVSPTFRGSSSGRKPSGLGRSTRSWRSCPFTRPVKQTLTASVTVSEVKRLCYDSNLVKS